MTELEYLRTKCELQDKFIKGEIDRAKLNQKLGILMLKYIVIDCDKVTDEFKNDIGFERKFHDNMGAEK